MMVDNLGGLGGRIAKKADEKQSNDSTAKPDPKMMTRDS